jgi:hypothetical protein
MKTNTKRIKSDRKNSFSPPILRRLDFSHRTDIVRVPFDGPADIFFEVITRSVISLSNIPNLALVQISPAPGGIAVIKFHVGGIIPMSLKIT